MENYILDNGRFNITKYINTRRNKIISKTEQEIKINESVIFKHVLTVTL